MYYFFHQLMLLCAYLYITKFIKIFISGWRFNLLASCLSLYPGTLKKQTTKLPPNGKKQNQQPPLHLGYKTFYCKCGLWLDVGLLIIPALEPQTRGLAF